MSVYRIFFILLFYLSAQLTTTAQARAWISKTVKGDSVVFQGLVHNNSASILSLKYLMQTEKAGLSGKSRSKQQNAFKAVPKSTVPLAKSILKVSPEDYYQVLLLVFQNNILISSDTLQQGTAPIPVSAPITNKTPKASSSSDAIEIDGLIIDETRSKSARDFYELFYNKWSAPRNAKDYTITIKELPSRGRSARIVIAVNDKEILQRFLQPRFDIIEAMVGQAIYHISRHLNNNESLKQQMSQEDHKGSGIY